MISLIEKLTIQFRTWYWKKKYANRVLTSRIFPPNGRLILNPYESDYEYQIFQYCQRNTPIFGDDDIPSYLFKIHLTNGDILLGFPVKFAGNLLTLRAEKSEADGFHTATSKEFNVHLYKIKQISAIRNSDDWHPIFEKEPIYGYKAIPESNGRLSAKGHVYRLNKPNVLSISNPYTTDFSECYFHFCTSLEGVALCPGNTHYLTSIKNYTEGLGAVRLFRVKAEEHCIQLDRDRGWWVTNKLTVLEEVRKEEIYQYFMDNPDARSIVSKKEDLTPDFWEAFRQSQITPYVES